MLFCRISTASQDLEKPPIKRSYSAFFVGLISLLADGARAQPLESVLLKTSEFVSESVAITCEVENVSLVPLTAYTLQVISIFEDGTASVAYYSEDLLMGESSEGDYHDGPILPGQTKTLDLAGAKKPGMETTNVEIKLLAGVFADGRTEGEPELIEDLVHSRQVNLVVRSHWLRVLEQLLAKPLAESELQMRLEVLRDAATDAKQIYRNGAVAGKTAATRSAEKLVGSYIDQVLKLSQESYPLRSTLTEIVNVLRAETERLNNSLASRRAMR